ncbi:CRISPR-associated endonuclease Cas2 [Spiroplasma alleghenense]|uniref:CRISPR-associated endoribonuclease Cas2 n=1 Tax=Spiroplasma alleghenense TaxID=216931 RepID=A0A345Z4S6_9MOLU|nr:CRISPR-associated endonuclease Cas2 [Spiroplasma alleghenense]AXK51605.1 CRISPR-associated protein Cas2 [Spiroplasma alleghenense]
MRMILFYDLPMNKKNLVKTYNQFRNKLLKEGFVLVQYSVYSKICINEESMNRLVSRIEKIKPSEGNIRAMIVTEKQYAKMIFFNGKKSLQEKESNDRRLVIY